MISVVMPCYNEDREMLLTAVNSILTQTYDDIELIVIVDNPLADELISCLEGIAKTDSRIKLYINSQNKGITYSLNKGIELASGEYIARMDADDISVPERLENQLEYLEQNKLELIGGEYVYIDSSGKTISPVQHVPESPTLIKKLLCEANCIAHPTYLFKKDIWYRVRGYTELSSCEDYHFLLKAISKKVRIGVVPKLCLKYRLRSNSITNLNQVTGTLNGLYLAKNLKRVERITQKELDEFAASESGLEMRQSIVEYEKMRYDMKIGSLMYKVILLGKIFFNEYGRFHIKHILKKIIFIGIRC